MAWLLVRCAARASARFSVAKFEFSLRTHEHRLCACVCFLHIYSGRQACGRTSRGHTGRLIHLPSAVLALTFLARRIQPFLSLVDCEVEFSVLTNYLFSTCWAFFFFVRKNPSYRDSNSRPNVRRFRGYQVNYRGDRDNNDYE